MVWSTRAAMAAGLEPGDRASVWAPNIHQWIGSALGILGAGGVLVPLNTRFKGDEAAYVLGKSRARMLFTVTDFLDTDYVAMLRAADADLPSLEQIVVLGATPPTARPRRSTTWPPVTRSARTRPTRGSTRSAVDDLSDMIFTSGTTGRPKGVMVTHGQSVRVYESWTDVIGLREGDRYLIVNPFFHTFGYKAGWMSCIMRGATIVPLQGVRRPAVLAMVAEEQITRAAGAADAAPGHPRLPRREQRSTCRRCASR